MFQIGIITDAASRRIFREFKADGGDSLSSNELFWVESHMEIFRFKTEEEKKAFLKGLNVGIAPFKDQWIGVNWLSEKQITELKTERERRY